MGSTSASADSTGISGPVRSSPQKGAGSSPKSGYEFERAWASATPGAAREALLQSVPAAEFPRLLQSILTDELLCDLTSTLSGMVSSDAATAEMTLQIAESIGNTDRIDMMVMFMDASQKSTVRKLFDAIAKAVPDSSSVRSGLAKLGAVY